MHSVLTYWVVALLMVVTAFPASGQQELSSSSSKARKFYREAEISLDALEYQNAIRFAEKALKLDDRFIECYLLLGDIYHEMNEPLAAVAYYKKATDIDPDFYPRALLLAGKLELGQGYYREATDDFNRFLQYQDISPEERTLVGDLLSRGEFAMEALQDPVPFDPVNLGSSINSPYDEFINAITLDNSELYLTVGIRATQKGFSMIKEEDFYLSRHVGDGWSAREALGPPMNTKENEGALFTSPDGKYLLFSGCNQPDGYGSCDIYLAFRTNDQWGEPVNLGESINSIYWETQPCMASDGRTLYFVSNRPGGAGGSDIWYSRYLGDQGWSQPENLGPVVNTAGDEMAPFIHPDNRSLYFSSTGHIGMGGSDLFICRKNNDGSWSAPVNLGSPINTLSDEINLLVDAAGQEAYISSDMPGGYGGMDIYRFELHPGIQPLPVTYMKGRVRDALTKHPLGADFELIDLETAIPEVESFSDPVSGSFLLALPTNRDYALNVSAEGYAFYSQHVSMSGMQTVADPYLIDITLQPILPDQIVILRNIFFETDQYLLKPESRAELNKLVDFLKANPGVRIEIRGHTDQVGTKEYNDQLSLLRARSVFDFLKDHGIEAGRLEYNGYGFSLPLASNETEEGRRMNRRTEFRILGTTESQDR